MSPEAVLLDRAHSFINASYVLDAVKAEVVLDDSREQRLTHDEALDTLHVPSPQELIDSTKEVIGFAFDFYSLVWYGCLKAVSQARFISMCKRVHPNWPITREGALDTARFVVGE